MNLNKKNIIVTGANKGIGAEIVKNLHKCGANVICCSRIENKELTELNLEINKSNENKLYNRPQCKSKMAMFIVYTLS